MFLVPTILYVTAVRKTENLCFAKLQTHGFLYILQTLKILMD